jgi:hypothetical protein
MSAIMSELCSAYNIAPASIDTTANVAAAPAAVATEVVFDVRVIAAAVTATSMVQV